jgi:putative transposase
MIYHPDKHHWRSIRMKGYDYSQVGAYFVTVCLQDRNCLFVDIINGEMKLNAAGIMVYHWWNQLPHKYPNIELDEFIIMPNHLHGIIIVGADPCVCPNNKKGEHPGSPLPQPVSLSRMIQWFKTMTTNNYIRNVRQNVWHTLE